MNIQNHNNKILCNPSSIEDIEAMSHLSELKTVNDIIVDLVDLHRIEEQKLFSSCKSMIVGLLIDMMTKGKNVVIMFLDHSGSFQIVGGVVNYLNYLNA